MISLLQGIFFLSETTPVFKRSKICAVKYRTDFYCCFLVNAHGQIMTVSFAECDNLNRAGQKRGLWKCLYVLSNGLTHRQKACCHGFFLTASHRLSYHSHFQSASVLVCLYSLCAGIAFMNSSLHPSIQSSIHSCCCLYSLVLVLGALKVCMVLLNGVEDHTADAAGVTTAQPWRDRNTKRQWLL